METPLKNTRRKLKKIMKSKTNLSVSTSNIYQKKLKTAINVSLNSTRTVRTLQSNNRSLATSLEKMRQDFRQVHNHYALLLEENHELRKKILELQRINMTEKYIDQEVERRVEVRMELMKRKLALLTDISTRFLDTLAELSDICLSSKSSTLEDLSSTESADQNYSLLPNLPLISSDVSLENMSDTEYPLNDCNSEAGDFVTSIMTRRSQLLEMTSIMEQSVLCPSMDSSSTLSGKLDEVLESIPKASSADKKLTTKLPMRVAKQPGTQTNEAKMTTRHVNSRKSAGSPKGVLRRQTFVVADGGVDDGLITDVAVPEFLVSDCLLENEALDMSGQDKVVTPKKAGQLNEKGLPKRSPRSMKKASLQQSCISTPHSREQSPNKPTSQQQFTSPKGLIHTNNQRGTRSRSRKTSPKKSPVSHLSKEKHLTKKVDPLDQKSNTFVKMRNLALPSKSQKNDTKNDDKEQHNLYISNEFKLINIHKSRLEKSNKGNCNSLNQQNSTSKEAWEHTTYPSDDMELTYMEESLLAPIIPSKHISPEIDHVHINNTECESRQKVSSSRSRSKQSLEQAVGEADASAEEKIPDAITMRCTKPGQLMFAVARKESDGTRKNVPLVSKVRSRSKRKIIDMVENMAETQPETIFDFHDKTPEFLNRERRKVVSVFDLSADQSKLSPLTPLNKNKTRSRKSRSPVDFSSKSALQTEDPENNQNTIQCHEDVIIEVPLKDHSPPANSTYRTRSRSLGRRRHVAENGVVEFNARSQSRKRFARSRASSPGCAKTSSSSVTCSEVPSTISSSPATTSQHGKSQSSTSLTSNGVKYEKPNVATHLTADELKREDVKEYIQRKEIIDQNETLKSYCTRVLSEKQINVKEVEQTNRKQVDEQINTISTTASVFSDMKEKTIDNGDLQVIGQEALEQNRTSKSRKTKLSKRKIHDKETGANIANLITEDINAVTDSSPDEHVASVMEEKASLCIETSSSAKSDTGEICSDTSTKSTSELTSEEMITGTDVSKKKKLKTSRKAKERSLSAPRTPVKNIDSESESLGHTNFINTRREKTRGMKENKGYKDSEDKKDKRGGEFDDHAAIGDSTAKLTEVVYMPNVVQPNLEVPVEADQLLEQLRCLRTPAFSHSEDRQSEIVAPSSAKSDAKKKNYQRVRSSRIISGTSPERSHSIPKRSIPMQSPESEAAAGAKRRRAAANINYAELKLNTKLRRGDQFTSHYCTGEKISIYKSPKGKKKVVPDRMLTSVHNQSINEEA